MYIMANSEPAPLHVIQDSLYVKQDGWELDDISLCSSGNIAVSGHSSLAPYKYQSYVCIYGSTVDNSDSRDKPTLLYHRQFTHELTLATRYISFIKPNSAEIVTCRRDEVQVIDYNRDVVLRSRKVNGVTTGLSVSESQIFIGLHWSDIFNIYDNDLNEIKTIRKKRTRASPEDMAAAADRLYVITLYGGSAIVYSQDSGGILTEYTTGQDDINARSITVNIQHEVVAVLWNKNKKKKQVAVYSFNTNNCLVVFDVESGVSRIRISDKGRIVTGNESSGEVKIYDLAQFFTYDNLKVTLSSLLSESDLKVLLEYFKINEDSLVDSSNGSSNDKDKYANLLHILEERGILHHEDFHQLNEAFCHLGSHYSRMVMSFVDFYQECAEKVILPSSTQACIDAEGSHTLQLNGFSADWSVVDMSLGPGPQEMVVLSGYDEYSGKTSLDCIYKRDSDVIYPWLKTREFDKESSKKSKRFVSFIDESQIVTCCHNIAEIINLNKNESKCKACLPMNHSASCVIVRNENIYIGFEDSVDILVLNVDLHEKMKIKLKDIENMWPLDLAVSIGRLLICLGNVSSSKVFLFAEEDGKKLLEYRNDVKKAKAPLSVAIDGESDLVAILWGIEYEDEINYDMYLRGPEDRTYGYLSLHSLSQGYCLSVVSVGLSVCDFDYCECYEGCSSGKKVRISSGCVAVLDIMAGVKFFDIKKMFTSNSVKTALCQFISSNDCQELMCSSEKTEGSSDKTKEKCNHSDTQNDDENGHNKSSKTENSDDDYSDEDEKEDEDNDAESSSESESDNSEDDKEIRLSPRGMHVVDIILAILTDKKHMKSEDVSVLKEEISHTIKNHYARSVWRVAPKWEQTPFVRFKIILDSVSEVFIGPCDKIVAVESEKDSREATAYFYSWDGNNHTQPTLMYFREFNDIDSKLLISCLDENKVVTFCDDVMEVSDFNLNGKITKSLDRTEYGAIGTCMTTKDEEIYTGFKSSEVVIFDSDLKEKRTITIDVMDGEWPIDMTVSADRLFVCTNGSFSRALAFCKDGRKMAEYKYLNVHERFKEPHSITVDEHHDLIGISWHRYNRECEVTLHLLSKGHCLALLDYHNAVRFSFKNGLTKIHKLDGKFYLLDQTLMFEGWINLIASIAKSPCECEKLQELFQTCDKEVLSKVESMIATYRELQTNKQCKKDLMKVLGQKRDIGPEAVYDLKGATDTLNDAYTKKLFEPLQAFIRFTKKSGNHGALTLLDLHKSNSSREGLNCNETLVNGSTSQSQVQLPSSHFHAPSFLAPRNSFDRCQEKRPHNEPDHLVSGKELSGKRARITDDDFQATSEPTPAETLTPVTQSSMLQTFPAKGTPPSSLTAPIPENQIESQFMLMQSSHNPLSTPSFFQHQVGSDMIQQPTIFTDLHSLNQLGQNGQVQERQQLIYPGGPSRAQQVIPASISQAPQMREHVRQLCTPDGLPQLRNLVMQGIQSSPYLETVRKSPDVQLLQGAGQFSGSQIPANVTQNEHSNTRQTEQSVNDHPSQQGRHFLGKQGRNLTLSLAPQVQHTERNSKQCESIKELNIIEQNLDNLAQLSLQSNERNNTRGRGTSDHEVHMANDSESNPQPSIQHSAQFELPNNVLQQDRPDGELQAGLRATDCEFTETSTLTACERMVASAQSHFQKYQAIVLKGMNEKLESLSGSSKPYQLHQSREIPGTSSMSVRKENVVRNVTEHEQQAKIYLESLQEDEKNLFLAFKDMSDDREELVRRLVEKIFTGEERRNGNTSGTGIFQKLEEKKLQEIRHVTFYLCPIRTRKQFSDKLQDKEWKRLCEVIDTANRHYRQELKRQAKRKGRLPQT